jgi:hypothetical protein
MASASLQPALEQLIALQAPEEQRAFLEANAARLDVEETSQHLKAQADRSLRANIQHSLQTSELLVRFAELTGSPRPRALAYLAEANAR